VLAPAHLRNVDQALNTRLNLYESTVVSHNNYLTLNVIANLKVRIQRIPRVLSELLDTESDTLLLLIEVEDMYLDGALQLSAEGRALADIEHRMVLLRAACGAKELEVTSVDTIGREELVCILTLDVRRGIAETTAELLPCDDGAIDGIRTAEGTVRLTHLATTYQRLDGGGADDLPAEGEAIGLDDLHTVLSSERLVVFVGELSSRTEAVVIAEEEIRHMQLLMQNFADEGLSGVGCQLGGEDHRHDLEALKLPQSLEVAVGRIDVLTPVWAQDIGRVRDEGQDDETRPFVAGSIVAHL